MRTLWLLALLPLACAARTSADPWNPAGAESLNVTILGQYPITSPSRIWDLAAYVAPDGHEYAVLGADSVYIIDIADPTRPARAATIPPALPPYDEFYYVDVAIRGRFCYAAGRHGPIKIIDLYHPDAPVVRGEIPANQFCACSCGHPCNDPTRAEIETLFIDERGYLFVTGIDCGEGEHIYNLAANPINPPWVCHEHTHPVPQSSFYVHDVHVRDGIMYVSRSRVWAVLPPRWDILDADPICPQNPGPCGDNQTPAMISTFYHDGDELHAHSAWLHDDPNFISTCDEKRHGHVRIWDLTDIEHPVQISSYQPEATCHSVHNVYINDGYAYAAWYNKGLQIYNVNDPFHPYRVGYYEHPARWHDMPFDRCCDPTESDQARCYGIMFADPFLPSGNFIATEMVHGLLVGRFDRDASEAGAAAGDARSREAMRITPLDRGRRFRIVVDGPGALAGAPLDLLDAAGRRVARVDAAGRGPGWCSYEWDGRDESGRDLPSGIYFARPPAGRGIGGRILLLDR